MVENANGVRFVEGTRPRIEAVSCGACGPCAAGRPCWCRSPRSDGATLLTLPGPADPQTTLRWLSLVNALAVADPRADDAVLVLTDADPLAVEALIRCLHRGPVAVSTDGRDDGTRCFLSGVSPTGRAQVVLAEHRARDAVKAAQRGGAVGLPTDGVSAPSVTELVQRDVRLVAAQAADDHRRRCASETLAAPLSVLGARK